MGAGKGFPAPKCGNRTFELVAWRVANVIALQGQILKKECQAPFFMLEKSISIM